LFSEVPPVTAAAAAALFVPEATALLERISIVYIQSCFRKRRKKKIVFFKDAPSFCTPIKWKINNVKIYTLETLYNTSESNIMEHVEP
jgi:hypothetical protein